MALFKLILSSWRSILSIILAYGMIAALFLYRPDLLNLLFDGAAHSQAQLRDAAGELNERVAALFGFVISPASIFITLMILFARIVVLSVLLSLLSRLVRGLFRIKPAGP